MSFMATLLFSLDFLITNQTVVSILSSSKKNKQSRKINTSELKNLVRNSLPWWLRDKESTCNAGDAGWIPGWWRSPGEGNDHPLQYSCLDNSVDKGAWRAAVHGVSSKQQTTASFLSNTWGKWSLLSGTVRGLDPAWTLSSLPSFLGSKWEELVTAYDQLLMLPFQGTWPSFLSSGAFMWELMRVLSIF